MGQVLLVRHAEKGDGKKTGKKFHLSPAGIAKSLAFGATLPKEFVEKLKYVGGSEMSRSLHTALLIAIGAGVDPQILASDKRLGSENQLLGEFDINMDEYVAALEACNNSDIAALKKVCSEDQYDCLYTQITEAISDALLKEDGNTILGTHSPWLQIAIEANSLADYHDNVDELAWLLLDYINDEVIIIASSMDI